MDAITTLTGGSGADVFYTHTCAHTHTHKTANAHGPLYTFKMVSVVTQSQIKRAKGNV